MKSNSKKEEAKTTLMYGLIWIFLGSIIIVIPYLNGDMKLVYWILAGALFITGIKKSVKGFLLFNSIKKSKS